MNTIYEMLFGKMQSAGYPDKLSVLPDYAGGFSFNDNGEVIGRLINGEFNTEILSSDNEVLANITDGVFDNTNISLDSGETFFGISNIDTAQSWINPLDGSVLNLSKGVDGNWSFTENFGDLDLSLSDNMLGGLDITSDFSDLDDVLSSADMISDMDSIFDGLDILDNTTEVVDRLGLMDHLLNFMDWSDF